MQHLIVVVTPESEASRVVGSLVTEDLAALEQWVKHPKSTPPPIFAEPVRPGPKGKKVECVATCDEKIVKVGQVFSSASAASTALGLRYNGVSQALNFANGGVATVRNCSFKFKE